MIKFLLRKKSLQLFLNANTNKEKGMTILEVMAGVAILGISTAATTIQLKNVNNHYQKFKTMHAYSTVSSNIGRSISSINVVLESLSKSPNKTGQKRTCVDAKNKNSLDCNHNSGPYGFVLYRSGSSTAIAGSSKNQAVYYDSNGKICNNNQKPCIFRAYTTIRPHCLNEAAKCFAAQSLSINYTVELNENVPGGINYWRDKGWIDEGKKSLLVNNSFESNLQTNLVPLLDQGASIQCGSGDQVLQGVTLRLEPICTKFTPPTKGYKGPKGNDVKGGKGPKGSTPSVGYSKESG